MKFTEVGHLRVMAEFTTVQKVSRSTRFRAFQLIRIIACSFALLIASVAQWRARGHNVYFQSARWAREGDRDRPANSTHE